MKIELALLALAGAALVGCHHPIDGSSADITINQTVEDNFRRGMTQDELRATLSVMGMGSTEPPDTPTLAPPDPTMSLRLYSDEWSYFPKYDNLYFYFDENGLSDAWLERTRIKPGEVRQLTLAEQSYSMKAEASQ